MKTNFLYYDKVFVPRYSYHIENNLLVITIEAPNLLSCSTTMKIADDNNVLTFQGKRRSIFPSRGLKEGVTFLSTAPYYFSIKVPTKICIISSTERKKQQYKKGIMTLAYSIITGGKSEEEED